MFIIPVSSHSGDQGAHKGQTLDHQRQDWHSGLAPPADPDTVSALDSHTVLLTPRLPPPFWDWPSRLSRGPKMAREQGDPRQTKTTVLHLRKGQSQVLPLFPSVPRNKFVTIIYCIKQGNTSYTLYKKLNPWLKFVKSTVSLVATIRVQINHRVFSTVKV